MCCIPALVSACCIPALGATARLTRLPLPHAEPLPDGKQRHRLTADQTQLVLDHLDKSFGGKSPEPKFAACARSLAGHFESLRWINNEHVRNAFLARQRAQDGVTKCAAKTGRPSILPDTVLEKIRAEIELLVADRMFLSIRVARTVFEAQLHVSQL